MKQQPTAPIKEIRIGKSSLIETISPMLSELKDAFRDYRDISKSKVELLNKRNKEELQAIHQDLDTLETNEARIGYLLQKRHSYTKNKSIASINRNHDDIAFYSNFIKVIDPLIEDYKIELKTEREVGIKRESNNQNDTAKEEMLPVAFNPQSHDEDDFVTESTEIRLLAELPEGFKQIDCQASQFEIRRYFSILAKELRKANGRPYMEQADVDLLIRKNFSIFKVAATPVYVDINLTQGEKGILKHFIYGFYLKYDQKRKTKEKYANFLIWNFNLYKDDNLKYLLSNMTPSKSTRSGIIDIKKHLNP